jgi:hypothetical protein
MANFALIYNLSSVITLTLMLALQSLRDHRTALVTDREANDATNPATTNSVPLETCLEDDDPWNRSEAVNEHQDSIVSTARTTARSSDKGSSNHAFWLVQIPLSLYVLVFASQALWIWIRTLPHFLAWTRLGLVVCGVASGLAGAGLVASAGRYEASVAMSPYITVRVWTGCSDGVMVVLCHGERAFPLISSSLRTLTHTLSFPRARAHTGTISGGRGCVSGQFGGRLRRRTIRLSQGSLRICVDSRLGTRLYTVRKSRHIHVCVLYAGHCHHCGRPDWILMP